MPRAMSVFSNSTITEDGLESLMRRLQATPAEIGGWRLERSHRVVFVELGTNDMEAMPDDMLKNVAKVLGAVPRSRVGLVFDDASADQLEFRMAKAVALAMSEIWDVVLDDHAGMAEKVVAQKNLPNAAPKNLPKATN